RMVPAPGRFSTRVGCPDDCAISCARRRAWISALPPGGYGTMIFRVRAPSPAANAPPTMHASKMSARRNPGLPMALSFRPLDRLGDQAPRLGCVAPAEHLDPLAGLEVLVVLEEVLDLLDGDFR